ncbi:MAG: hypothetical protein E6J23_14225 [Chloroflexi bacterium]|nr:MAG: hypothetical protein E6J23_14225 [Chloroflexota bacterium]
MGRVRGGGAHRSPSDRHPVLLPAAPAHRRPDRRCGEGLTTLQKAAVHHRSHAPFVQALGGEHFYIRLVAAAGDLARATCRYADTPHQGPDLSIALEKEGTDGIRDWWSATVHMPSRRLRYEFELEFADGTRSPFSERGFTRAAEKYHSGYFHYPYNQPVDRFTLPSWLPGTTFYEIFPERFHNGASPGSASAVSG